MVSDKSFITFGSGGNYAYAGLIAGMGVQDAVLLAAKCDPYTNDQIQFYDFNEGDNNEME